MERNAFDRADRPVDERMGAARQALPAPHHRGRNIDRVDQGAKAGEMARERASAAACVENTPRLRWKESCKHVEHKRRVGWTEGVGVSNARFLKGATAG